MVRLTSLLKAGTILIATAGAAYAASAEPPYGKSEALPITFQVEGGRNWCDSGIKVTLTSKSADALTDGSPEFQQMLGRIRAVIESECSKVQNIGYYGRTQSGPISIGESLKLTDWVYVPIQVNGKPVSCQGPPNNELCQQRWSVFHEIRRLFLRGAFSEAKLTSYLTTDAGADAEFISGSAKGRITFVPFTSGVPFATSSEFVAQQIGKRAKTCRGEAILHEAIVIDAAAYQSLTCRTAAETAHTHFVITRQTHGYHIIAFTDFSQGGLAGERLAAELNAAFSGDDIPWSGIKIHEDEANPPTLYGGACRVLAEEFAGIGSRPVAIRMRPERSSEPGQVVMRVDERTKARDPWQMRLRKLTRVEKEYLDASKGFGSWLVYRIAQGDHDQLFENQLFAATSPTDCERIRDPQHVEAVNLPNAVVELYADNLNLQGADLQEKREAVKSWSGTGQDRGETITSPAQSEEIDSLDWAQNYPPALLMALKEFTDSCLAFGEGSSVELSDNFVTRVDIDGDGDLDYIANGDGLACKSSSGSTLQSGGGNGVVHLWILTASESGAELALHTMLPGATIEKHNGFGVLKTSENEAYRIWAGRSEKLVTSITGGQEVYTLYR